MYNDWTMKGKGKQERERESNVSCCITAALKLNFYLKLISENSLSFNSGSLTWGELVVIGLNLEGLNMGWYFAETCILFYNLQLNGTRMKMVISFDGSVGSKNRISDGQF